LFNYIVFGKSFYSEKRAIHFANQLLKKFFTVSEQGLEQGFEILDLQVLNLGVLNLAKKK
jgi:hypothetical protein